MSADSKLHAVLAHDRATYPGTQPDDPKRFATLQAAAALDGICIDRFPDGKDRCRYLVRTHLRSIDCVDLGAVRVALVRQAGELDAHRSRK